MKNIFNVLFISVIFISCSKNSEDYDANGNLLANKLTSETGGVNFTPMQNEDSSDVNDLKPEVYSYDNKPYTGKIVSYDEKNRLMMEGNLKDGIYDGEFKFYYPSGNIQVQGNYKKGYETGMWFSYYAKDKPSIVKFYDENGYMLMRKEYYDTGRIKNYQNIKVPQFGNIARRIQFKYNGDLDYIDAEREIGQLTPKEINELLKNDGLLQN